jgi:hypothetical protein
MDKGDRVIATDDISTGIFASVRKGTKGVITDTGGFLKTWYEVSFDGDDPVRCDEDDIELAGR